MEEKKYEKYLPIGTVVLLKEASKKIMIVGFCVHDEKSPDQIRDYVGCLYPEGIVSSDVNLLFDHNQIDKIYYLGYNSDEDIKFKVKLNEFIKNKQS